MKAFGLLLVGLLATTGPAQTADRWGEGLTARLMKKGYLLGAVDPCNGKLRPTSRYEVAVAMHATLAWAKFRVQQLGMTIHKLAQTEDLSGVASLQKELRDLRRFAREIPDLREAFQRYKKELVDIGAEPELSRQDLDALERILKAFPS